MIEAEQNRRLRQIKSIKYIGNMLGSQYSNRSPMEAYLALLKGALRAHIAMLTLYITACTVMSAQMFRYYELLLPFFHIKWTIFLVHFFPIELNSKRTSFEAIRIKQHLNWFICVQSLFHHILLSYCGWEQTSLFGYNFSCTPTWFSFWFVYFLGCTVLFRTHTGRVNNCNVSWVTPNTTWTVRNSVCHCDERQGTGERDQGDLNKIQQQ